MRISTTIVALGVFVAVFGWGGIAEAQRTAENTAPVCVDGVDNDGDLQVDCADPDCRYFTFCNAGASPETPMTPGVGAARGTASTGWSLAAGILGFVTGAITLSMGITAAVIDDEDISAPVGGVGVVLESVMVPVVAVGARSARRGGGVRGCLGCRIAGWVTYGISLGFAVTMLGLAFTDADISGWGGSVAGVLSLAPSTLMAIDALVSRRQARRAQRNNRASAETMVFPTASMLRRDGEVGGAIFGLALAR